MSPIPKPLPASVLFVCTRNKVRSVMAEALLKRAHPARIYADSVGVAPDEAGETDPLAASVMQEIGLDISRHHAKPFAADWVASFDLLIALSPEARLAVDGLARTAAVEVEAWDVPDVTGTEGPRAQQLEAYRSVRDRLAGLIRARFPAEAGRE